jgi:hypothetical protein
MSPDVNLIDSQPVVFTANLLYSRGSIRVIPYVDDC